MKDYEYDNYLDGRINKYKSPFFHIYLEGESPITNNGFKHVSNRDYASFIHEYIHYIQQITTPYGIKYNSYFVYSLILFRSYIETNKTISTPVVLKEAVQEAQKLESELCEKNGSKDFTKGCIEEIEINPSDIISAKINKTAVNIGVYDFTNNKAFEIGFQFGYTCVMESMAHLIQSLVNPDLYHAEVPYKSAQIICAKILPELKDDTKLLISICYTALFFDNPGYAFIEILQNVNTLEDGMQLFQRYMQSYSIIFQGETMPNYRMMHILMDKFVQHLQALLGSDLIYFKNVIDNCKNESSSGQSLLLNSLYGEDLNKHETLKSLLDFYGFPAVDSNNTSLAVPYDPNTNRPYLETGCLVSLELIYERFTKSKNNKTCIRYSICNRISRRDNKDLINEFCAEEQWKKELPCLFTGAVHYFKLKEKKIF